MKLVEQLVLHLLKVILLIIHARGILADSSLHCTVGKRLSEFSTSSAETISTSTKAELCMQGDFFLSIARELRRSYDTIWNSFYT